MEIGVSTATFFQRSHNEETLDILNKLDSRVCEIFLESFCEYKKEYCQELKSKLGNLKVHSIHTLSTHFEPQLFSKNERAYSDALALFEEVLSSAQLLGAKNYTMHGRARIKKGTTFDNFEEYGEYFNKLIDMCYAHDMELTIENVEWAFYGKVGFFKGVKRYAPRLKTCFDIKQAKISGYDYKEYIEEMKGNINTVHLSDFSSDGKVCLPGRGVFDFKELFLRLFDAGFNGNMLIEVYKESFKTENEVKESLDYLRNIKNEVFGNE